MKTFNAIKFVTDATTGFNAWLNTIDNSDSFEEAGKNANASLGYIDCMITFLNSCIRMENNEFTSDLDEVIDEWTASVYQHMINKAVETKQPHEVVMSLIKAREGE